MQTLISEEIIECYRSQGVVVLRDLFKDWVKTLRKGVDFNIREPSSDGKTYVAENGGGRFLSDYCNWQRIAEYRDFIFNSPAASIGAQLMQSTTVRLFHEHVLVKEAQAGIATPWHQDQPYYCVEGPKTVSLWIPLDEVSRDRTLEFVTGSHLWGKLYRPQRFNGQPLNENDGLDVIPDIDGDRAKYDIKGWALSPGDAVAFDYRIIHGAPPNMSKSKQRRAFSLRLVGDETRFVRREGITTSPPFRYIDLSHNDPLDGDSFPILCNQ